VLEIKPEHEKAKFILQKVTNLPVDQNTSSQVSSQSSSGVVKETRRKLFQFSKQEILIKIGLFFVLGYYYLLLNSPVWPIETIVILLMGMDFDRFSRMPGFLSFPIDHGMILLIFSFFLTCINIFVWGVFSRVMSLFWFLVGMQYLLPPIILGLQIRRPDWKARFWTDGMKGLAIIGSIYVVVAVLMAFGVFEKRSDK